MIDAKILPAHILRAYTWATLQANGAPIELIGGLMPIIPLADEPQVQQAGKPYIIYGFAEDSSTELREIHGGLFVLRIIAQTFAQLGTIQNIIVRSFENEDDTAANVNAFSSPPSGSDGAFNGIRFTTINIQYTDGGLPPDEEGGPVESTVNIHYKYVTHYKPKVFRAAGTKVRQPNGTYITTTENEWV